jgi:hypothetical protein
MGLAVAGTRAVGLRVEPHVMQWDLKSQETRLDFVLEPPEMRWELLSQAEWRGFVLESQAERWDLPSDSQVPVAVGEE